ncbi:MerR family transcriptional regulator [Streptomyces canus]|uniref:MerR family transcriptional regulator n=1 Tax=Streptomyces canus TaxID=58343 RepID=UPI0033F9AD05
MGVERASAAQHERRRPLSADRIPGGHRQFHQGAVERVQLIQELHAAGLSSSKIAEVPVVLFPCVRGSGFGPG